ncbi:MAG: hypothetical protein ACYCW6_01190 [Candidatus Xenobia bacterium]
MADDPVSEEDQAYWDKQMSQVWSDAPRAGVAVPAEWKAIAFTAGMFLCTLLMLGGGMKIASRDMYGWPLFVLGLTCNFGLGVGVLMNRASMRDFLLFRLWLLRGWVAFSGGMTILMAVGTAALSLTRLFTIRYPRDVILGFCNVLIFCPLLLLAGVDQLLLVFRKDEAILDAPTLLETLVEKWMSS